MRILSLGAGVQSSTIALMACEGDEHIDAAIFADTGWEPKTVYEWLAFLEARMSTAGIPLYRVTTGDLRADELRRPYTLMPLRMQHNGRSGMLRRQCTDRYKIRPINKQLRALGATKHQPCDLLIGISLDEYHRMKPSQNPIARHLFPLVERRLTREDCLRWLKSKSYPEPLKSSCVGCPFHDNAHWRTMRDERPEEWDDAVAFDKAIREQPYAKLDGIPFLHRSLVPLETADLSDKRNPDQPDLFDGCGTLCPSEGAND